MAFTIPEPDLVPEGIAHDPTTGTFFVGSTYKRKIVAVDRNGTARDFTTEGQDGLLGVVGMKVDVARRRLWAAAGDAGVNMPMKGMDARTRGRSGVFMYDVETGKRLRRYLLDAPGEEHFLNDLVVAPSSTTCSNLSTRSDLPSRSSAPSAPSPHRCRTARRWLCRFESSRGRCGGWW